MSEIQDDHGLARDEQRRLFPLPEGGPMSEASTAEVGDAGSGRPRLRVAERRQIEFRACCWDDLLGDDHEARMVWQYVASLDLTPLLAVIKAVEGRPGHPPID